MAEKRHARGGQPPPEGPPPERPVGEPIRELHPTMDARFVLVEIGKLMSMAEAHTKAIEKLGEKVGALDETVKNAKLIGKVALAILVPIAGGSIWLMTALWPYRDKLIMIFGGAP